MEGTSSQGISKEDRSYYEEGIRKALQKPDEEELKALDELKGIGPPIASTILYFAYPDKFPIMDRRVIETLRHSNYKDSLKKARSPTNYERLRKIELEISKRAGCSLRKRDKALFAYHKKELEPKCRDSG